MKKILPISILTAFLLFACEKKDNNTNPSSFSKDEITGVSQKGPFVNGSSVTAFELNESFGLTGRSFNSFIKDNSGSFELDDIHLLTKYAKLRVDGFYYNEITNMNSQASLTLYALSDLSDKSKVNVNVLTNLELARVEYLISNGSTFAEAKKQAQQEVLNIFSIKQADLPASELLDITKETDNDAVLLAVSVILQGFRSEADLTQLMGDISTDIQQDGILNDASIGSRLINDARLLNMEHIRGNLTNKFQQLGIYTTIPNFEKHVTTFLDSTNYVITNHIDYPEFSSYGENILFGDKDTFYLNHDYSMAADLPAGSTLKIIIKYNYPHWGIVYVPDGPVNWAVSSFDAVNNQQVIESKNSGVNCDLLINFSGPDTRTPILEYYENNSVTPQKIKSLYVR